MKSELSMFLQYIAVIKGCVKNKDVDVFMVTTKIWRKKKRERERKN
jgi:hypothetical protein